ncbi:hypothetical protein FMEAI12_3280026 [Parafrankia sp. Ea1.12]|nr:hypothetical protein FMEAI12_3280026 [Parafrankia sp. Ea1.12]
MIVRPKSRAGRRTIVIPLNLAVSLRAHRAAQRAECGAAGGEWVNEQDLVFVQPNGRPLDPRADHRAWQDLLSQAGVRAARLHDARHTMASLLLAQGVHPRVVMEINGSLADQPDPVHLQPCGAGAVDRRGRPDGRGPVGHRGAGHRQRR